MKKKFIVWKKRCFLKIPKNNKNNQCFMIIKLIINSTLTDYLLFSTKYTDLLLSM